MTNIELINKENLGDSKHLKIINRIDIGAKTISNIYDDLTYLMLKHKIISQNENINVNLLTEQRLEYFATLIQMKKITLTVEQKSEIVLFVDRKKLSKLIDNILSNAIKYNRVGGTIFVSLSANSLTIEDSGRGIRQEHIEQMFERYTRFDKSVGGFGIGLNIVKMICDEYGFSIKIESEFTKQTKVTIAF
jgi:two-component system OmpR family sensor kinase